MTTINPQTDAEWAQYAMQLAADGQLSMEESQQLADLIEANPELMGRLEAFRMSNPEQYQYLIDYAPTILAQYPTLQPLWNIIPGYTPPIDPGSTPAPTVPPLPPVESGKAALRRVLEDVGLGALADWAWEQHTLHGVPLDQIFLDMRDRPEYKARFPAMEELSAKGRALSEAEYIAYEKQAAGLMRAAGLPEGFYDQPDDFAAFLKNEVSVAELQARVELASTAVFSAPQEVRDELERIYGVTQGDLTAYWLDPGRAQPLLEQRFEAARIGGTAITTGYGALAQTEAERLAQLGIDQAAAQQGFTQLSTLAELFSPLDRGEAAIGRETQLGAAFEGDAASQAVLERRARRRAGVFEAGGQFSGSREGIAGVGAGRT